MTLLNVLKTVLSNGRIFNVTFFKQNGEVRSFNARLGVKSKLHGGKLPYNPDTRNNIVVYSMDDNGYRTIKVDNIIRLKANGVVYSS